MDLLSTGTEWRIMDPDGNPCAQHPFKAILPHLGSGRIIPEGYDPGVYHVRGHEALDLGGPGVSSVGIDRETGTALLDGQTFWVRIARAPTEMPSIVKADPARPSDPLP